MGAGEEDKEERERKAHKRVDDATPVSGPFLKAVVASQDLGAAGTEFERSLISFPCNKNYHFLHQIPALLSLLFQCQSISLSRHIIPPIFSFFFGCQGSSLDRFLLRPMLFQIGVFGGMRNQIQ
jgi:hypothetical protein